MYESLFRYLKENKSFSFQHTYQAVAELPFFALKTVGFSTHFKNCNLGYCINVILKMARKT